MPMVMYEQGFVHDNVSDLEVIVDKLFICLLPSAIDLTANFYNLPVK